MTAGYILCTTPRSGSTLLCTLLAATGRAGAPDSFYHADHVMREWAAAWGLADDQPGLQAGDDARYLQAVLSAGRAATPVFGMRLQQPYLAPLAATLDRLYPGLPSDAERFQRAFGDVRYLHLTRADKVAQAVSLVRARQSGLWHRNVDGTELERSAPAQEPVYDHAAIAQEVASLRRADQAWTEWFDHHRIEPIRVAYEAFALDPATTTIGLCTALGVEPPAAAAIKPGLARLADAESLEWIERYRKDGRTTEPRRSPWRRF